MSLQRAATHVESSTRLYGVCVDSLFNEATNAVVELDHGNKGRRRRAGDDEGDDEVKRIGNGCLYQFPSL